MKKVSRIAILMLVIVTLCSCFLTAFASGNYVSIMNPSDGQSVDADSNLKVQVSIGGARPSFQQIAFRDLTTDVKYIFNENFSGSSYKISKKMLTPGHSYRVWVATFDERGEKLAQDIKEFQADSYCTIYTCPFRGDYQTDSFAKMYAHCVMNGCFKDNPFLKASWEGGWSLLGTGLDNPLYGAICDLLK